MKKNGYIFAGLIIISLIFLLGLIGRLYMPYNPEAMSLTDKLSAPSFKHLLGTDNFGRDIFNRIIKAVTSTTGIAFMVVLISSSIGILIGAFTGYFGGILDEILMQSNNVITAFPKILLALIIINFAGNGKCNVILALSIAFIPSFARVSRIAFSTLKNKNYVVNAKLMGASSMRILFLHIFPNTMHILVPAVIIGFNNAILAEAGASFLELGVTPPDISLGYMLLESQGLLRTAPWYALSVGIVIVLIVFSAGLVGQGLLDLEKR